MIKIKDIGKMVMSLLLFFYTSVYVVLIMRGVLNMDITSDNIFNLGLVDFVSSTLVTIAVCLIYKDIIIQDIKKFINLYKKKVYKFLLDVIIAYLILNLVKYGAAILETILYNLFNIEEKIVSNQSVIETLLDSAPIMMIISICVIAPIEEEMIFRGAIRKIIKNKKVYIAVSGLIFGLMHVTGSLTLFLEILLLGVVVSWIITNNSFNRDYKILLSVTSIVLILLLFSGIYYSQYGNLLLKLSSLDFNEVIGSILYIATGCYLAYIYVNHDNILMSMGVHSLSNAVSVIVLLFLQ